jgi:serine/threonine protein kinase
MFAFLKCVGQGFLKCGLNLVLSPFGAVVYDIAKEAWDNYKQQKQAADLRKELEEIVQSTREELKQAVSEVVEAIAAGKSETDREALTNYLALLPSAIQRSLRSPSDPSGATVPYGLPLSKAQDLIPLLPQRVPQFKVGQQPKGIGDWKLEKLLGVGGFGEVWKASSPYVDPVALKFCLDPLTAVALRNEADLLRRVSKVSKQGKHPGIVKLQHTYLSTDTPCLEYEYVEGSDLTEFIYQQLKKHQGKMPPHLALDVLRRLVEIMAIVHKLDPPIVHRDLKPANILVRHMADNEDQLRITDFGIGGIAANKQIEHALEEETKHGFLTILQGAHTPLYASPQQIKGEKPSPRDDVYSLGIIWYQLVTGDLRMTAVPPEWRREVQKRGLSPGLTDLLESCINSQAEERPADATELGAKLAGLLSPIQFKCPNCKAPLKSTKVKPIPSGAKSKCPKCGIALVADATQLIPLPTPPSVCLTSPANGSTVSGTVPVGANASDNMGVTAVQFYRNGATLGSRKTAIPYSLSWDTTTVANGIHTLTAQAWNAAGNTSTSAPVTVSVVNVPKTPPPTPAAAGTPFKSVEEAIAAVAKIIEEGINEQNVGVFVKQLEGLSFSQLKQFKGDVTQWFMDQYVIDKVNKIPGKLKWEHGPPYWRKEFGNRLLKIKDEIKKWAKKAQVITPDLAKYQTPEILPKDPEYQTKINKKVEEVLTDNKNNKEAALKAVDAMIITSSTKEAIQFWKDVKLDIILKEDGEGGEARVD